MLHTDSPENVKIKMLRAVVLGAIDDANVMCVSHDSSVGQNTQGLAVLDDIVVDLIQGVVLELEPFPGQLRRQNAGPRLLQELILIVGAETQEHTYCVTSFTRRDQLTIAALMPK